MMPISLYLHFPFCVRRCDYCVFNSGIHPDENEIEKYVTSLCRELELRAALSPPAAVNTIYFGGGTPSLMGMALLERIISKIKSLFSVTDGAEVTLEANPATTTRAVEMLSGALRAGVTRLSVGVQSLNDEELALLGRAHNADEATSFFKSAKAAGFASVSLDLIYGFPGQTIDSWKKTLSSALLLNPDHISLYCLEIERGSKLYEKVSVGALEPASDDAQARMYDSTIDILSAAGFNHYEISNWAKSGHKSRHNLSYWTGADYLGVGVSACGFIGGWRYSNVNAMNEYNGKSAAGIIPLDTAEKLSMRSRLRELAVMKFRTMEITPSDFLDSFNAQDVSELTQSLEELAAQGMIEKKSGTFFIPRNMLFVSDEIFRKLI